MSKNKEQNNSKKSQDPRDSELESTGIKAVLEQSLQSYDKLPMLDIIFEKFIRQLSTALRNLTSEAVEVTIKDITSLRFSTYFDEKKSPNTIVVFKAVEWENLGLLILDNDMIFSFVDILLGGKKNNVHSQKIDPERVLTSIEQGLARQISEIILYELGHAFDQISPTTFNFERMEANPNFVSIVRPGDAVITLSLQIEVDEQIKHVDLLMPYKTIEPVKEQMQQMFLGDKFGNDQEWERLLSTTILNVGFPLEAVITDRISNIKEIAKLKIGDTIIMNHHKDKDVMVRSGPISLFSGKMGKVEDKVAIYLNNTLKNK